MPDLKMFKVGDRVKRVGKGVYPAKYDGLARPDDSGQGYGLIGTIVFVSEQGEWPPGSGKVMPTLYFVQFQGFTGSIGIIAEHLMAVSLLGNERVPFMVGDRVTVATTGSEPKDGTIVELWAGSGLDKYHVRFGNSNSGWFYGCDIRKN